MEKYSFYVHITGKVITLLAGTTAPDFKKENLAALEQGIKENLLEAIRSGANLEKGLGSFNLTVKGQVLGETEEDIV